MDRQFVVVNNGMTDLRGHYYENGLSVAEAARERGFRVGMAAHAGCDLTASGIVMPDWLNVYPMFRLNHWGNKVSKPAAGLFGLRGSLSAVRKTSFDAVLSGKVSVEQYLLSRFDPLPDEPVAPPPPVPVRRSLKRYAKAALPPLISRMLRAMYRQRGFIRHIVRELTPPGLVKLARQQMSLRATSDHSAIPIPVADTETHAESHEAEIERFLTSALITAGIEAEVKLTRLFQEDLDRLLCLADIKPLDHVYLPTAHGREALAVHRLVHELGEYAPTFHLEFRHAVGRPDEIEKGIDDKFIRDYTLVHRAFFDAVRSCPEMDKIRYYADTDELAADYSALSGLHFDVLPIPFRVGMFSDAIHESSEPLTVLFLGDARREKGIDQLPGLVRSLRDLVTAGQIRFVIQATLHPDESDPLVRAAVEELGKYPESEVKLIGLSGFLDSEEYYLNLIAADVVICPYRVESYRARSSGVFAEAVLAGKPTIVPSGTWMAGQTAPGAGVVYDGPDKLALAVREVSDGYQKFRNSARRHQTKWASLHTPARLVSELVGTAPTAATRAA